MSRPDYRVKLDRAKDQIESLHARIQAFIDSQPYRLVTEFEQPTRENVVRLKSHKPPPEEIAPSVGEILTNLRSSLDQVAYALSTKSGPLANPRQSAFPIITDPMKWEASGLTQIPRIAPAAQEAIKHLQPFKKPVPKADELALLDELNNIDKHRLLHAIQTVTTRAEFTFEAADGGYVTVVTAIAPAGGFANQAEVGRVRLPTKQHDGQLHARFRLPCEICFQEGAAAGRPVGELLSAMHQRVWLAMSKLQQQHLK